MSLDTQSLSIDMSLRMWSESVNLATLLRESNLHIDNLHIAGDPISSGKKGENRIARRHFISLEKTRIVGDDGLHDWVMRIISILRLNSALLEQIARGQVEVLLWIAIFGRQLVSMPCIAPNIVVSCSQLGLKVMLENYTDFDEDGAPRRLWLS